MDKVLVTGGAGFIASNLCDYLLSKGLKVVAVDNFSTGNRRFLSDALSHPNFALCEGDLLDFATAATLIGEAKPDTVIHLASNADVRFGLQHSRKDLEQGTLVTYNVLEAARLAGVKKFAFSSTGSIYGEPTVFPTPENCPFPVQTSLYAAAKLASEGLIQAYCTGYGMTGYIFRFVSILGERYSHGHVFDFAKKLLANPNELEVLGDGKQTKSYLYVGDCLAAIWHVLTHCQEPVNIFNLGTDEYVTVNQSLDIICKCMGVSPKRHYTGGERGWIGDSPFIFLDCYKVKQTGWRATKSIRESIELTLKFILANQWIFKRGEGQWME